MIIYDTKSTATRILQICSLLRGFMQDTQMQQIAVAFTFLRRIDCLIERYAKPCSLFYNENKERLSDERLDVNLRKISGGYPFYNYSGYTLEGILLSDNSIDVVINTYFQGFSKNILEILDGMDFKQNLAILQRQSRYLVDLLQCFVEMDLSSSVMNNEEFVKLITLILSSNPKENYTPIYLSNLICGCLFSEDIRNNKDELATIYDPVCGTGSMLAIAGEKVKTIAFEKTETTLYGQEVSIFPSAIAKALVLLTGSDGSKVLYGNTLTDDLFRDSRFQYIVADLPLGLSWMPIKDRIEMESFDDDGRFNINLPSTSDSQFLFIQHILSKMDTKGSRAAFITSSSVLWMGIARSGESRIRRWLFENDLIETIIALPEGTLSYTKKSVFLWILSNKKKNAQKGLVHLIDTNRLLEKDTQQKMDDSFVNAVVDEYKRTDNSDVSQFVRNEQFGYYEINLLENGKKTEVVSVSLDTDIDDFIKNERQPYAKGKITIDYSSVEKGFSVRFEDFFKKEDNKDVQSLHDISSNLLSLMEEISSLEKDIYEIKEEVCELTNDEIPSYEKDIWYELPLRSAVEVIPGNMSIPFEAENGKPLLSVPYLRKQSSDGKLYAATAKNRCSTVNNVLIIVKGANTGEVFRGVDGILTPSLAAIRCINKLLIFPKYLYYLLKGNEKSLMLRAKGESIKTLDSKAILDLQCLMPPIEEQKRLVSHLDNIVGKIDKINKALNSTDNTFAQFRQTLIENVVHGYYRFY